MLHQLDQHAAGVLRVGEVVRDPAVPVFGSSYSSRTHGSKVITDRVDVGHGVRHLLNSWTTAVKESTDGGVGTERAKWIHESESPTRSIASRTLLCIDFFVVDSHMEGASVEGNGFVEIGDRDADMVDARSRGCMATMVARAGVGDTCRRDRISGRLSG